VPSRKRPQRSLLDGLSVDAPYFTETRRLIQNLHRLHRDDSDLARSYMVTSAGAGEGKSTICSLMAIASARIFQRRTLLVDGDLRRPSIHSLLGVTQAPGLFELLRHSVTIRDAVRPTGMPTLSIIPSGKPKGSIGDAYDDDEFAKLIAQLRSSYDVIFVDCPPAVPAIEPVLMAEHIDSIILVAMAGHTQTSLVRRLVQIMAPVSAKIVGVILNNARDGLPYYYDYRYYGYGPKEPSRIRRASPHGKHPSEGTSRATKMGGER
jgi:capsular exopolysaccharide synthesis family protein